MDRAALLVAAALTTGLGFLVADAARRAAGRTPPLWRHFGASMAVYAVVAVVLGLLLSVAWLGLEAALARVERRSKRLAAALGASVTGLVVGLLVWPTARWTFSGAQAERFGPAGPWAMTLGLGLSAFVLYLATLWAWRRQARGARRLTVLLALVALMLGAAVAYVDLTVYVALYGRLHTLLEVCAAVLWLCASTLLFASSNLLSGRKRLLLRGTLAVGVGWLAVYASIGSLRTTVDTLLRHVWLEPAYVGRMLGRVQTARAYLSDPRGWRGAELSRMAQLGQRFDLATTTLNPAWDEPLREPEAFRQKIDAIRGPRKDLSIIVYYVDTLRYDVASNPAIMPNVARLAAESVTFTHAYASGSDTMRSLPTLTGGNFELGQIRHNDLLRVAERAGMKTSIAIAQSAHEFLAKMRPSFSFQEVLSVRDYSEDREDVWGYGADRPTAGPMVDRALEWLRIHKDDRFLLWMFNFDQHAWRELDNEWMTETARRYDVPDEGDLNWRYRVVARSVDAELGRFLSGLDSLGLRDDAIVIFVSDHGEALGRDGFWVHSIFLWESLVRVPLTLRIPGVEPKVVYDSVGLVDLAPTLARYISPEPDLSGYQGEDLLGYLVPGRPKRRLPLLFAGAAHDTLLRIGILDPQAPYKMVLPLETGVPEVYDTTDPDPDWVSVADDRPKETLSLLSQLVRSPLFPRTKEDLDIREKAKKSLGAPKR